MSDHIRRSERPILDLLTDGFSNKAIALRLDLATKTVDSHIANIKERTGINNRVLLAIWWHDCGGLTA